MRIDIDAEVCAGSPLADRTAPWWSRSRCVELAADSAEQGAALGGAIDGQALPARTDAQVSEEAGRIFVEVEERGRASTEQAAFPFREAVDTAQLAEKWLQGIERYVGGVLHGHSVSDSAAMPMRAVEPKKLHE